MTGATIAGPVHVFYPRGVRTGGPEALHQLVDELRRASVEAWLVPLAGTEDSPRVPDYDRYDAPEAAAPADLPGVTVVVPENRLDLVWAYRRARVVMWWLSIDYAKLFYAERRLRTLRLTNGVDLAKRVVLFAAQAAYPVRRRRLLASRNVTHVAQCVYAQEFLRRRLGVEAPLLSDVTRSTSGPAVRERGNRVVAYNPSKGGHLVRRVLTRLHPDWEVVPLHGMTGAEVEQTLGRAAVYLDLGHHPGKDRMPREAATAGAVVVAAARGSAVNEADLPIPARFKLPLRRGWERAVVAAVDSVLDDPEGAAAEQQGLRRAVLDERRIFALEVVAVFGLPGAADDRSSGRSQPRVVLR